MLPSIKALLGMGLDTTQAQRVRDALSLRSLRGLERFPRTKAWVDRCHNRPWLEEIQMAAADEAAGTYGVEALWLAQDSYNDAPAVEYLNVGDSYRTTLLRLRSGACRVSDIGTWIESHPTAQNHPG